MLLPTAIDRHSFRPIGSIPSVNLLRDFNCRGQEHVNILSLACGDVRDVLFSVFCEANSLSRCRVHFVTCDHHPAVIARNVLLYTLIYDNIGRCDNAGAIRTPEEITHGCNLLWSIYFHLRLPESQLQTIQDHARKLLELSKSTASWTASCYGRFLDFCTENTRIQLRLLWEVYAASDTSIRDFGSRDAYISSMIQSAYLEHWPDENHPLTVDARFESQDWKSKSLDLAHKLFWQKGAVSVDSADMNLDRVNPAFTISTDNLQDFHVEINSNPLSGFCIDEAENSPTRNINPTAYLAKMAQAQFHAWCTTFECFIKRSRVQITVHCGDALNLCYSITSLKPGFSKLATIIPLYERPLDAHPLTFSGSSSSPPQYFDVIDTSRLMDSTGLLNILVACAPLLALSRSCTLYTNTASPLGYSPSHTIEKLLPVHTATLSLLIGIVPLGYLLQTQLNPPSRSDDKQVNVRTRLAWKRARMGDPLTDFNLEPNAHSPNPVRFETNQLALLLHLMYDRMLSRPCSTREDSDWTQCNQNFYTGRGLAMFLRLVRKNVITDWDECMRIFFMKIKQGSTKPNSANLQELVVSLHQLKLFESPQLNINTTLHKPMALHRLKQFLSGLDLLQPAEIPGVIFCMIRIPSQNLTQKQVSGRNLYVASFQSFQFTDYYSAIDCFFGILKEVSERPGFPNIELDPHGWSNGIDCGSDCFVSFQVPTWTLLEEPRNRMRFQLRARKHTCTGDSTATMHPDQVISECGLDDCDSVWFSTKPPGIKTWSGIPLHYPSSFHHLDSKFDIPLAMLTPDGRAVSLYMRKLLKRDHISSVSYSSKFLSQSSPCILDLRTGSAGTAHFEFPFPVELDSAIVGRGSSGGWAEVTAPLSYCIGDSKRCSFMLTPFPVVKHGWQLCPWSLPRIDIEQHPSIDSAARRSDFYLRLQGTLAKDIAQASITKGEDGVDLIAFRRCLNTFLSRYMNEPIALFRLEYNGSTDTLIYVDAIRFDRDASFICLDAYVLPLTTVRALELSATINILSKSIKSIKISESQARVWKHFWPAVVERCRISWEHKPSCEYIIDDQIPRSTSFGESPICSCGEIQTPESLKALQERSKGYPRPALENLMRQATRVAIPPLFSSRNLESPLESQTCEESKRGQSCDRCFKKGRCVVCKFCQTIRYCYECVSLGWGDHAKACCKTYGPCDRCGLTKSCKYCHVCKLAKYCHGCSPAAWVEHRKSCAEPTRKCDGCRKHTSCEPCRICKTISYCNDCGRSSWAKHKARCGTERDTCDRCGQQRNCRKCGRCETVRYCGGCYDQGIAGHRQACGDRVGTCGQCARVSVCMVCRNCKSIEFCAFCAKEAWPEHRRLCGRERACEGCQQIKTCFECRGCKMARFCADCWPSEGPRHRKACSKRVLEG